MKVVLAGQDITSYVDEYSIDIADTLGQGPGVWGGGTGRAATCKFMTTLGPAALAQGSGQKITQPSLVRMGEVQVFAKDGTLVYAGYVGQLSDKTERTRVYTEVACYDYWQHLDRIIINEVFNGHSDVHIISSLLNKYAGWIDRSELPKTGNLTFGPRIFRNTSLQKALQKIVDSVGWTIWIDYHKRVHYYNPAQALVAPFGFSTSPDFRNTFDMEVTEYEIDDTSAINRVTCFGGRHLSQDITQDLSTQANGRNTIFQFPFYPHEASDGKYHVKVNNGHDLVLGFASAAGAKNTLKPKGQADVLLNTSAKALTFAKAPPKDAAVSFRYRYEIPLVVSVTDKDSFDFYGMYLDGTISDETILETSVAIERCKILLFEQSRGLTTLKLTTRKNGLSAGMLVGVHHAVRGIDNKFIVQEVHPVPLGGGQFKYEISLGAWSWKLVDVLLHTAYLTTPRDDNIEEDQQTSITNAFQINETITIADFVTFKGGHAPTYFYVRSAPLHDGHDAYPGFAFL